MRQACDLCRKDEAVVEGVLCRACAESIGRLMSIKDWLAALPMDKARNDEQFRLLVQFQTTGVAARKPYREVSVYAHKAA